MVSNSSLLKLPKDMFHTNSAAVRRGAKREIEEMSRSMMVPKTSLGISVKEMVSLQRKGQDEFGVRGYEIPKYNPHLHKPTVFSIPKVGKPRDYISVIQNEKKKIPGPDKYELQQPMGKNPKFFMPKGNSPSYINTIINSAKKVPGVGLYKVDSKKPKIPGNYTQREQIGGVANEAIYRGLQSPSHYNPVPIEKLKSRSPQWKITKPLKEPERRIVKNNSPSPVTYKQAEALDATKPKSVKFKFTKTTKISYTDQEIKKSKVVPGVGHYKTEKADRIVTIGARRGYK